MVRRSILLPVFLLVGAAEFVGQSNSVAQDFTYSVWSGQNWTDTGLDLQSGDVVEIFASAAPSSVCDGTACDPNGVNSTVSKGDLPLSSATPGALIARLHAQGAALLVGASRELHIDGPSHLLLRMNMGSTVPCEGALSVKVHRIPGEGTSSKGLSPVSSASNLAANTGAPSAQSATATSPSSSGAEPKTRGQQLKSQLSAAAQIFLSGQFGSGKPESGSDSTAASSNAVSSGDTSRASVPSPPLKVSDAALDADLGKNLDSLPRRVNDQSQNLGDMVNFVIIGPQKDLQAALDAAAWHVADTSNEKAVLSAIVETYEKKDYLQMPMSTLYLFGRKQDFGYEMAEPIAMVASRHHFRIWKAPFTWKGQEVWVGAGTHDIGFAKDKRNGNVTHKIDPLVDGERDNIGGSLQKANKTKTMSYYLPQNPVREANNATGDRYRSDGRLLVIFLQ
jgi:hypothetical protein